MQDDFTVSKLESTVVTMHKNEESVWDKEMTGMMHTESPADCHKKKGCLWETNQDSGRTVTTLLAPATTHSLAERPQPKRFFPIMEDNFEVLLDITHICYGSFTDIMTKSKM